MLVVPAINPDASVIAFEKLFEPVIDCDELKSTIFDNDEFIDVIDEFIEVIELLTVPNCDCILLM
jgi:hypothetical protein